jgi:hypothetical protein
VIFPAFESTSRRGVFSDDTIDHEFESTAMMAQAQGFCDGDEVFNRMKLLGKTVGCDFFVPPPYPVIFALENDSKALAFCAARSHIVAVR